MTNDKVIFQSLSQVFTTSTFKKIIYDNDFESFNRCINRSLAILKIDDNITNLQVIKKVYRYLNSNYRNEYLYKNALFNRLVKEKKLKDTVVLNELRINQSIADTVFINGEAVLYEVKTELDNADKLLSQIIDYRMAFGKIILVTHHSSFYKYYQLIKNKGIGLICLGEDNRFNEFRPATEVKDYFDHAVLFKLLRKSEYSNLIRTKFGRLPDVPNTLYFKKCLEVIKSIPIEEFQALVMKELKSRRPKGNINNVYGNIPSELRYICHSINMKQEDFSNLSSFLNFTFK